MEEQEQLRRQIRLLQGLIDDHKNVHGNAPVPPPAPAPRWRNPRPAFSSQGGFSTRYPQQMQRDFALCHSKASAWRNKYSLVNLPSRPTPSSGCGATATRTTPSSPSSEAAELQAMVSKRNEGLNTWGRVALVPPGSAAGNPTDSRLHPSLAVSLDSLAISRGGANGTSWPLKVGAKEKKEPEASSTSPSMPCKTVDRSKSAGGPAVCQKGSVTPKTAQGASKHVPNFCRTVSESAVTLKSEPQPPLTSPDHESCYMSARKKPAPQIPALHTSQQPPAGKDKPNLQKAAEASAVCTNSTAGQAPSGLGARLAEDKQSQPSLSKAPVLPTSIKSPRFRKTSYTWVAANPSKSPRTAKRGAGSKAPESARRSPVSLEATAKLQPRDLGAKQKKSSVHAKCGVSSSQYKWKASGPQPSPSVSSFTWRRKDCGQGGVFSQAGASTSLQAMRCLPFGQGNPKPFFGNTGFLNYKLRSRTKIIKRKGNACSPVDKRTASLPSPLLKSRYSLRKRSSHRGRSSPTTRRAAAKGLVQIGRHRLRRLPPSRPPASAKAGSSSLLLAGPSKVVNTRYRIVKKTAVSPSGPGAFFSNPAHSWRTRRLSASRSLVPSSSRHLAIGCKTQALQHRWRNRGLRCIGGVMYRVSANKLAKTSSSPVKSAEVTCRSHTRAARLDSALGFPGSSTPIGPSRAATSRSIASRAVQRSLAIIRQARQKKEKKKEYCMYYNRFGKCNRGENCPYIHDPEKVAVCTRFLRGTCKKTDGTCPFSHKVSKDKMPVCSYFLKGICSNSDCPYSHVYVSRKAEVCSDFLKGYCPLGEKCKKKHTLVCPDFSKCGTCPKGSQCKLQHPKRKRRAQSPGPSQREHSLSSREGPAAKTVRKDKEENIVGPSWAEEGEEVRNPRAASHTSKLAKLPSFISLQTPPASPSEEDPKPERERHGEEAGKPLQIKPRL